MAEVKTRKNDASVTAFLKAVPNARRSQDAFKVLELMQEVTGEKPAMWGDSIVGFGSRPYRYASGREGDWPKIAFSPRKTAMTLYLSCGTPPSRRLLSRLGKHKMGKGCLYVNKLEDVDLNVLRKLIQEAAQAG